MHEYLLKTILFKMSISFQKSILLATRFNLKNVNIIKTDSTNHWTHRGHLKKSQIVQYRVCHSFALATAVQRLRMDRIRYWISCKGIASHSWRKNSSNWSAFWWSRHLTRRSSTSHKCSIGERSGENASHGNTLTCCQTSLPAKKTSVVLHTKMCSLRLSCVVNLKSINWHWA